MRMRCLHADEHTHMHHSTLHNGRSFDEELFNNVVILVFFDHKKYSHSFVPLMSHGLF